MSANHQPRTLVRKAYAGFFWQILGFSLNTILSVAHIIIMARLLSPEIFGQFAIAGIIIALGATVSGFGLGPALVQKTNISDADITFVFLFNVATGLALYLLLYSFSDNISAAFNNAISPLMVKVLALNLLAQPVGLASKALLLRKMDFHKIFVATNLAYFIGMLLVGVSLALLNYGVWSLIIGFVATSAVASLYFLIVSSIRFSFKFNPSDARYLFRYGIGQTAVEGVNQMSNMADRLILSQLTTNTFLGLYERSQRIQQMPGVFIGGVLDTVLFSTLSKFSDNKPVLGVHFFNAVMIAALIGVYLSVLLFTFSELIILLVLGEQWLGATFVLQMLSALIGFQLLSRLGDSYVRATGVFNKSIYVKCSFLILIFALAFIGYQFSHVTGALIGVITATAIHSAMMIELCRRDSGYSVEQLGKRLQPGVIFAILLMVKNAIVLNTIASSPLLAIGLVLLTDVVLIIILLNSTRLLGKQNSAFIFARLHEIADITKSKIKKNEPSD